MNINEDLDKEKINNEDIIAKEKNKEIFKSKENISNRNRKEMIIKNAKSMSIEIITIMCGTFITALGFLIFLSPYEILPGGFMSIAQIIYDVLAKTTGFTAITKGIWYIIMNMFLYLFAVKCMGWKFAVRAGVGIASYSIFVEIIERIGLSEIVRNQLTMDEGIYYILFAIYGGIVMGIGIGLIFRGNGSAGGSDIVAIIVNKFFPTITTGQIMICVDGAVVILSAIVYQNLFLPLYALIAIFLCGRVSDIFVDGIRSLRAYYVVTEKKEELSQAVFNKLNRGVTNIKCEGMFTHNDKDMLLIVVRRAQVLSLKKIVKSIDPNSFMFSHNIKEAYGNGFIAYEKAKLKKNKIINEKAKTDSVLKDNVEENLKKEVIETQSNRKENANETFKVKKTYNKKPKNLKK